MPDKLWKRSQAQERLDHRRATKVGSPESTIHLLCRRLDLDLVPLSSIRVLCV